MRENEKLKGVPFIEAIVHGLQASAVQTLQLQEARAPTTMYYMECNHNVTTMCPVIWVEQFYWNRFQQIVGCL